MKQSWIWCVGDVIIVLFILLFAGSFVFGLIAAAGGLIILDFIFDRSGKAVIIHSIILLSAIAIWKFGGHLISFIRAQLC